MINTRDDHTKCPDALRQGMADMGIEIIVSTAHPLIRTPYTIDPYTCPHGIDYWIEPTSEQRAQWARDGVR